MGTKYIFVTGGVVSSVGTAVYGRVTYQMMESYWPTVLTDQSASKHDREHAQWLENADKVVFSRTLGSVDWNNARLVNDNIAGEISKLKQQPGKDAVIFGSPALVRALMPLGLIDDYRLTVNPVVLGEGIPFFADMKDKIGLDLLETKIFKSGVLGLHYRAQGNA